LEIAAAAVTFFQCLLSCSVDGECVIVKTANRIDLFVQMTSASQQVLNKCLPIKGLSFSPTLKLKGKSVSLEHT